MNNGYSSIDAREYAQLEIDAMRRMDSQTEISILDFSEKIPLLPVFSNPPNAPVKICRKVIPFLKPVEEKSFIPVRPSAIPSFIKLPTSKKKLTKLQDKWTSI